MPEKGNIFIGSCVHRWNDNRIFFKEATSLAKEYNVELHAPANFERKHMQGVEIYGLQHWKKESDRKAIRIELWQHLRKSKTFIFHFHIKKQKYIGNNYQNNQTKSKNTISIRKHKM